MSQKILNPIDFRQMVDISKPYREISTHTRSDPRPGSKRDIGTVRRIQITDNRYIDDEIGRYMEWRSGLIWDDMSGGRLVVRIEDESLISFYDNEWMLDNMVTDIGERIGIDIDFDSLSELHRMLFGPSE